MRRFFALLGPLLMLAGLALAGCGQPAPPPLPAEVSVFLTSDVTVAQRTEIERVIRTFRLNGEPRFETRAEAYENFKRIFSAEPELVGEVRQDSLPESWRLTLADPAQLAEFEAKLEALPGVDSVVARATVPPTPPTTR